MSSSWPLSCPICLEALDMNKRCPTCRADLHAVSDEILSAAMQRLQSAHAAQVLAAAIDIQIYCGALDPRSAIGQARLDYGNPFDLHEARRLLRPLRSRQTRQTS